MELRIRRLDTWRHRARDHSTRHRPLPTCWWSFGTKPVSPVVFEILASNSIGSRRHFRVTWHHRLRDHSIPRYPFPIGTPLSPSRYLHPFSEIMGTKHIGVMSLTFQGHVTSSVTWPLDSGRVISYWWSFGPKSLSLTVSEIFRPKHHVLIDTMLNRHCACAYHVTYTPYVKFKYIFQFLAPTLPIHYLTFIELRWRIRGVLSLTSNVKGQIER